MKVEVVYGPPGCGKTTYLVNSAKIIAKKYDKPILFVSFTKAAAKEAKSRIDSKLVNVSTIHSLGYHKAGINKGQVIDYHKLKDFGKKVGFNIKGGDLESEEGIEVGDRMLALLHLAVAKKQSFDEVYTQSSRPTNAHSFDFFVKSYVEWKKQYGYVDFNDMLVMFPDNCVHYDTVIIDEGQDLSPIQWDVIEKIVVNAKRVIIAGDDDQAIYEWGGADLNGMQKFEKLHNAKRTILGQSYRVPEKIHALSQKLVRRITDRVDKEYLPADTEGVITKYGSPEHVSFDSKDDTLILYRNHMYRKELENVLIENLIPYYADSGFPGLLDNKYGKGIKAYNKLTGGGSLTIKELSSIKNVSNRKVNDMINSRAFNRLPEKWYSSINVPYHWRHYYEHVDMVTAPNVRISSIHGSKGREADRVILHTGMAQRTLSSSIENPDAETRVFYVAITRTKNKLDIIEGYRGFKI
jgi:DNA helicase II / ATP-dependent DNA helicase PcrA